MNTLTNKFLAIEAQNFPSFEPARRAIDEAGKVEGFRLVNETRSRMPLPRLVFISAARRVASLLVKLMKLFTRRRDE